MSTSPPAYSGSVPQFYDRYRKDLSFDPFAADLVLRIPIRDGLRILELACGTGILTRRVLEALPDDARVVATDLNEPMIAYARHSVADERVTWQVADAQDLPFGDESFDILLCAFGFMFLPDKVHGFREARRVLEPGGLLLANTWHGLEENRSAGKIEEVLQRLFPDDPPQFLKAPYGYGDHARIRADMEAAGWTGVSCEDVTLASQVPSAVDVALGYIRGTPLYGQLAERGADTEAVIRTLAEELVAVGGERPYRAEHTATVITARR